MVLIMKMIMLCYMTLLLNEMYLMMTDKFNQILESEGINVFSINDATRIINKPSHYTTIFLSRDRYLKRVVRGIYYS